MFTNQSSAPTGSAPNRQMLRRALVLMALFGVLLFALLLARLFQLQILEHARYEQLAMEQQLRDAPTSAARGVIYDTHRQPLALSASMDNVYLSPAEIQAYGEDPELIARGTEIILYLGAEPSSETEILPDLTGMNYEQARDTLSYYGLYLKTTSPVEETDAQRVGGQSVAAGTALDHGSVITVTLIDSDETMLGIY